MKTRNRIFTASNAARSLTLVCLAGIATSASPAANLYFDAGVSTPLTWDQAITANWSTSSGGGPYNTLWAAYDYGFFKGTAGTITVSGGVSTNGLTFQTDGYVLNGGTITTGSPTGGTLLNVGTGITATIASNIAQTTLGMSKTGAGTLTLSSSSINTTGGSGESLRVLGGTLNITGQVYSDERSIRVDGAGAILKVTGTGRIYHSTYTSAGTLTVQNGGTVELENWGYGETSLSLGGLRAGANALVINNGTIRIVGTTATNYERGFTVQSGGATFDAATGANWTLAAGSPAINYAVTYTGNPSLTFTGAGTGSFDKVFSGTGGLTKSGAGTWTLGVTNTYSGATNVNVGTLLVNNTSGSGTGTSAITVASGATLGGTGALSGAVTVTGKIAPGSTGIESLGTGAVTWKGAATAGLATDWNFQLGSGNTADLLNITGNFTKNTDAGSIFRFDFLGSNFTGIFTLAQWSGSTTFAAGDFSYTNLGGGKTGTFTINGSTLQFTAVPEPTSALAGALLGFGLLRRRRSNQGDMI